MSALRNEEEVLDLGRDDCAGFRRVHSPAAEIYRARPVFLVPDDIVLSDRAGCRAPLLVHVQEDLGVHVAWHDTLDEPWVIGTERIGWAVVLRGHGRSDEDRSKQE